MEQGKGQLKENVQATDRQQADAVSKGVQKEQDPGTGYYGRKDPDSEHLKNSISRHKWEH